MHCVDGGISLFDVVCGFQHGCEQGMDGAFARSCVFDASGFYGSAWALTSTRTLVRGMYISRKEKKNEGRYTMNI
jgi:hypothetical protein